MGYDFVDDGIDTGMNYNPFVAPRLKEVRVYSKYFLFMGDAHIVLDY